MFELVEITTVVVGETTMQHERVIDVYTSMHALREFVTGWPAEDNVTYKSREVV